MREPTIGNANIDMGLLPDAMVADLGEVAPLPAGPQVSVHYRQIKIDWKIIMFFSAVPGGGGEEWAESGSSIPLWFYSGFLVPNLGGRNQGAPYRYGFIPGF